MTTSARRFRITGLSVAATLGFVMGVHAVSEDPSPAESPPAGSTASGQEQFLLLTDGRLIQGIISREDSFYIVKQRIGVMRFPKKLVEGSFASLHETYQYKIARLPEDDTSERRSWRVGA